MVPTKEIIIITVVFFPVQHFYNRQYHSSYLHEVRAMNALLADTLRFSVSSPKPIWHQSLE